MSSQRAGSEGGSGEEGKPISAGGWQDGEGEESPRHVLFSSSGMKS